MPKKILSFTVVLSDSRQRYVSLARDMFALRTRTNISPFSFERICYKPTEYEEQTDFNFSLLFLFIILFFSYEYNNCKRTVIILDKDVNAIVIPYKSTFFSVAICECVLAALLIISAFGIKFLHPKAYKQAKKWYAENITVDINVSEFIKEANNENQDIRN